MAKAGAWVSKNLARAIDARVGAGSGQEFLFAARADAQEYFLPVCSSYNWRAKLAGRVAVC
jgi:hypothetical protein